MLSKGDRVLDELNELCWAAYHLEFLLVKWEERKYVDVLAYLVNSEIADQKQLLIRKLTIYPWSAHKKPCRGLIPWRWGHNLREVRKRDQPNLHSLPDIRPCKIHAEPGIDPELSRTLSKSHTTRSLISIVKENGTVSAKVRKLKVSTVHLA